MTDAGIRSWTLVLLLLLVLPATATGDQQVGPRDRAPRVPAPNQQGFHWAPEQLEDLIEVMARWSRYESPGPDDAKRVFAGFFDTRSPQETLCIRAIEQGLVEHLEEQDGRHMLALTYWQVELTVVSQVWTGEPIPRTRDFERVDEYLVRFRDGASKKARGKEAELRVDLETQLGYLGVGELYFQRGSPAFLERADQAFDLAVEIDPDFEPARYWSAFLKEKIRAPVDVLRPWRELVEDHPEEPEYRLRFGLVARRAERRSKAAESLTTVARDHQAPAWMRRLAYEEWVQVLLEGSERDRREARAVLEAARREFPSHPQLDLLAVYLEMPRDRHRAFRWAEATEVSAARRPAEGLSPRVRYELAQAERVDPPRNDLVRLLRQRRHELGLELGKVTPSHLFRWHVPPMCRPLSPG